MGYQRCKHQIKSLKNRIHHILNERNEKILSTLNESLSNTQFPIKSTLKNLKMKGDANFALQKCLSGHHDKISALKWSSDSMNIVSASQDGSLIIWDTHCKKKLGIPLRMAWVMTVDYSPNNHLIASGGLDNLCAIYNIKDKTGWNSDLKHRELQQHEGYVSCCRFTDNEHILTSSGDSRIILWDIDYQTPIACYNGQPVTSKVSLDPLVLKPKKKRSI